MNSLPQLTNACALTNRKFYLFPLHYPIFAEDGTVRCSCGDQSCSDIGKHPATPTGYHAATVEKNKINNWFGTDEVPRNIGIALVQSHLVIVAPDDDEWNTEFERRGLPDTYTVKSGNGWHYYYRMPTNGPVTRICKSKEYDIVSDGYIVAAGSVHRSGKTYTVINDGELAEAPQWVLDTLWENIRKTVDNAERDDNEPPIRLPENASDWWHGRKRSYNDAGALDRSMTLYVIACQLARAGCQRNWIADALKNRDAYLFENQKYSERRDADRRYLDIADNAIRTVETERSNPSTASFPHTDLGNAERFIAQHGAYVRYIFELKQWAVYDGTRWQVAKKGQINQYAKDIVRAMYAAAADITDDRMRERLATHARNSEHVARIRALIELAQTEKGNMVSINEFDTDAMIINTLNCTIDLRTRAVRPHRPEDMLMKQIPVMYTPDAVSERWIRFLERVQPNPAMRQYLQRIAGYMSTGLTREEVFFILYGGGENGKGTFTETLLALWGDYGQTAQMSTFVKRREDGGDKPSSDIARMKSVRMVATSETNERAKMNEGLIKSLTGGDTISARFLYGMHFDFIPTHKHIFAVNSRPDIGDTTHGMWRRVRLIPFEEKILPNERDDDLKRALREEELAGIFNWCLDGCTEWQTIGLSQPEIVTEATQEYRDDSDPLQRWIEEGCTIDSRKRTSSTDLYESYKSWCSRNDERYEYKPVWGERMKTKGFEPYRTKSERGFSGLAVKPFEDTFTPYRE